MSRLSKRRVYVMDCGDFVKIGVSGNVEKRKKGIPFKVRQYYCTDYLNDAFKIEKKMHKKFSSFRVEGISGTEYFNVSFLKASNSLRELTDQEFKEESEKAKKKDMIIELLENALQIDLKSLSYLTGFSYGVKIEKELKEKREK